MFCIFDLGSLNVILSWHIWGICPIQYTASFLLFTFLCVLHLLLFTFYGPDDRKGWPLPPYQQLFLVFLSLQGPCLVRPFVRKKNLHHLYKGMYQRAKTRLSPLSAPESPSPPIGPLRLVSFPNTLALERGLVLRTPWERPNLTLKLFFSPKKHCNHWVGHIIGIWHTKITSINWKAQVFHLHWGRIYHISVCLV